MRSERAGAGREGGARLCAPMSMPMLRFRGLRLALVSASAFWAGAGAWYIDPVSKQASCVDADGKPACESAYVARASCNSSESGKACLARFCARLKDLVNDNAAHVSLQSCSLDQAQASAALRARALSAMSAKTLAIGFTVKGDPVKISDSIAVASATGIAISDWRGDDKRQEDAYIRADQDWSLLTTTVSQAYCLGIAKKLKHKSGRTACLHRDSAKDTTAAGAFSSDQLTVNRESSYLVNEWVKVQKAADATKDIYFLISAVGGTGNKTLTMTEKYKTDDAYAKAQVASGDKVFHLGNISPSSKLHEDAGTGTTIKVTKNTHVFFRKNQMLRIGAEFVKISADPESESTYAKLTVVRAQKGTTATNTSANTDVHDASSCIDWGCEEQGCAATFDTNKSSCVTNDGFTDISNIDTKKCKYFDCQNTNLHFVNDLGCCTRNKGTCNSKFKLHGSDSADKVESDTRWACANGEHVAMALCDAAACVEATDRGTCCVNHNNTGSAFGSVVPITIRGNFSSHETCANTLKFGDFYQDLSDGLAKALGVKASDVVLASAPSCSRARALASGKELIAETTFHVRESALEHLNQGEASARAQGVYDRMVAERLR